MWDLKYLQEARAQDLMRETEQRRVAQSVSRRRISLPILYRTRPPRSTLLWRALYVLRFGVSAE
jgi:hypothetical protein